MDPTHSEAPAGDSQRVEETLLHSEEMSRPSRELHRAVKAGWVSALRLLLWAPGARVDARDAAQRTALHYACESRHKDAERVVDMLLRAGAAVDARDGRERTALYHACESEHEDAARIVDMLLRAGAAADTQDGSRRTPLHEACRSEHKDAGRVVELLLRAGAVVNAQDGCGRSPLHEACKKMNVPVVVRLLKGGASISVVDETGWTPLHITCLEAAESSAAPVVNALLAAKLFVTGKARDIDKHWAGHMDIEEIHYTANLQTKNHLNTPLHLALQQRPYTMETHNEVIYSLLRMDAEVEFRRVVKKMTELSGVCENNVEAVVSLLLAAGAKVGVQNYEGMTALHFAGKSCAESVVRLLVDKGEYVNSQDFYGNTPLHLACSPDPNLSYPPFPSRAMKCRAFTIDALLTYGANLQMKNGCQKTPYDGLSDMFRGRYWKTEPSEKEKKRIEKAFIKHVISRRSLNLPEEFHSKWRMGHDYYKTIRDRCCKELKFMKNTQVLPDVSLYDILSLRNQPYHQSLVDVDQIRQLLLSSPWMKKSLRHYYYPLLTTAERTELLTVAVHSFYSECRKTTAFPYVVAKQILAFLCKHDLTQFLLSDECNEYDIPF